MTKSAGTEKQLAALHKKLTQAMLDALDSSDAASALLYQEREVPLPDDVTDYLEKQTQVNPALLTAVSKFLKDNDITCPVEESKELDSLEQRLKRKRTVGNITHLEGE